MTSSVSPLTVARLLDSIPSGEISEAYLLHYPEDEWSDKNRVEEFKNVLRDLPSVSDPKSGLRVRVYSQKGVGEDRDYIHVDGMDSSGELWALDFMPWSEWKACEVFSDLDLSQAELAAAIYQEMTWNGWPESMEQRRAEVEDAVEQLKKDLGLDDST